MNARLMAKALRLMAEAVEAPSDEAAPPAGPSDEDRLGAGEVAALGLTEKGFRRICREGAVPAERHGRAYRVRRADLLAYLATRRVQPRTAQPAAPSVRGQVEALLASGRLRAIAGGKGGEDK